MVRWNLVLALYATTAVLSSPLDRSREQQDNYHTSHGEQQDNYHTSLFDSRTQEVFKQRHIDRVRRTLKPRVSDETPRVYYQKLTAEGLPKNQFDSLLVYVSTQPEDLQPIDIG